MDISLYDDRNRNRASFAIKIEFVFCFFFNDTATTEIYTLALHDALPICWECDSLMGGGALSMHGSYVIDIISYLSGKKAKSVNGMTQTYVKDTDTVHGVRQITCDDFCTFQLEMETGLTASCTVNSLCFGDFTLEIIAVGSKGRLVARNHDLYVCLNDQKEELILHKETKPDEAGGDKQDYIPSGRLPFPIGQYYF